MTGLSLSPSQDNTPSQTVPVTPDQPVLVIQPGQHPWLDCPCHPARLSLSPELAVPITQREEQLQPGCPCHPQPGQHPWPSCPCHPAETAPPARLSLSSPARTTPPARLSPSPSRRNNRSRAVPVTPLPGSLSLPAPGQAQDPDPSSPSSPAQPMNAFCRNSSEPRPGQGRAGGTR